MGFTSVKETARGFTLVELLVSLAVIGLLATVLLAAETQTMDQAKQQQCRENLMRIGEGMTGYALDHHDYYLPAKRNGGLTNSFVQIALELPKSNDVASVGLDIDSTNSGFWTCPYRPRLPFSRNDESGVVQWYLGYQYFGGITNWCNKAFFDGVPSRSPARLSDSKPGWVLGADVVMKVNGEWGAIPNIPNAQAYEDLPPHHEPDSKVPSGGNELYVDGSVGWVPFDKMYHLTTWQTYWGQRVAFFYQDTNDFYPALLAKLPELSSVNYK